MSSYLFGNVRGAAVDTHEALFVAAAATPEHVHAGGLEERVSASPQLAGHLHARLSRAALRPLPFLIYNCGEAARWAGRTKGPDMPTCARVTLNTVILTRAALGDFTRWVFGVSPLTKDCVQKIYNQNLHSFPFIRSLRRL